MQYCCFNSHLNRNNLWVLLSWDSSDILLLYLQPIDYLDELKRVDLGSNSIPDLTISIRFRKNSKAAVCPELWGGEGGR